MSDIKATAVQPDIICVEAAAGPAILVVFGASGDLAKRKLIPSLFQLFRRDLLSTQFHLIGAARTKLSDHNFRQAAIQAIKQDTENAREQKIDEFANRLYYISGDYKDAELYSHIKEKIELLSKHPHADYTLIFYLAVPPFLYAEIASRLKNSGLACPKPQSGHKNVRLVVEKPFGRDLESAAQLDNNIRKCFEESQIYRIDHYLGKETVQNILVFRFANTIFEPVWNRNYIDSIQITIAETLGVEHRASYYDKSGALRDIFQNHMLQMLALVAMEPPTSFEADRIRDEKVKLLRSIRPFRANQVNELFVRGMYGAGEIGGRKVAGYRSEPGVKPDSRTETFVAAKLFIDNWRWKGVPFYLRTGKRLAKKQTEISVTFRQIPHSMFYTPDIEPMRPNVLVLRIQPQEEISLNFQAKRPGSKICIDALNMSFAYKDVFGVKMPEAYQRLLLDCMLGDQTLFTRYDAVETAWKLLDPVIQAWENDQAGPHIYSAGSESFPEADRLVESDGRKWRKLAET
jgi:glucose-6-phosphate 1-dehydrogenase